MTLSVADCSDGELAALAMAGRQSAYVELMHRHREPVYRIVRGHVGSADDALDVTQQTFISAFSALGRYDGARPFRHWLSRIAINKCHDWARRRRVRRFLHLVLPIAAADDSPDLAPLSDAIVADRAELARTMIAIATLPANLKEPLLLRSVEGLSQTETAELLGISEKAVETRVYRARMKLTEMLRG